MATVTPDSAKGNPATEADMASIALYVAHDPEGAAEGDPAYLVSVDLPEHTTNLDTWLMPDQAEAFALRLLRVAAEARVRESES